MNNLKITSVKITYSTLKNCCGKFCLAFLDTFLYLEQSRENHHKLHTELGGNMSWEKNMHGCMLRRKSAVKALFMKHKYI